MAIKHRRAEVFYDAECAFCGRTARVFENVLIRRHVRLLPMQTLGTFDEMLLRFEDGTIIGGADAVVDLARRIWWGWPLFALSRVPGAMPLMRSAYRWVARHRGCARGMCRRAPERTSWPGLGAIRGRVAVALPLQIVASPVGVHVDDRIRTVRVL
jgi:predicted DCC family thiol-disulfide oxidoreductase YuxK